MHSSAILLGLAACLPELVSAHGYVTGVDNKGVFTSGANPNWYYLPANQVPVTAGWKAMNQDNGFVEPNNFNTADVACHKSATAGGAFVNANAGDSLTVYWNTWPDTHKGPIINYIAPYSGSKNIDKPPGPASPGSLSWSKISQAAIVSGQTWVTDTMIGKNFSSTVTIPRNLKAGNYVLRHEIIALHSAGSANGAQSYPQCINIKVSGSGTVAPMAGTLGTALYKATDPGILFNLYTSYTSYPYPGPALWTAAN